MESDTGLFRFPLPKWLKWHHCYCDCFEQKLLEKVMEKMGGNFEWRTGWCTLCKKNLGQIWAPFLWVLNWVKVRNEQCFLNKQFICRCKNEKTCLQQPGSTQVLRFHFYYIFQPTSRTDCTKHPRMKIDELVFSLLFWVATLWVGSVLYTVSVVATLRNFKYVILYVFVY